MGCLLYLGFEEEYAWEFFRSMPSFCSGNADFAQVLMVGVKNTARLAPTQPEGQEMAQTGTQGNRPSLFFPNPMTLMSPGVSQ